MAALAKPPGLTEKEFMGQLKDFAVRLGWFWYHPFLSQHSAPGWPDVTLVRERVVYAELKREGGKATPAQLQWIERLRGAGQEVYLWTPANWEEIAEVLTGLRVVR